MTHTEGPDDDRLRRVLAPSLSVTSPEGDEDDVSPDNDRKAASLTRLKRVVQSCIVAAELSPANEVARYAVFGWVLFRTESAMLSALAFGLATFCIESVAAVAAADLLDSQRGRRLIERVNESAWGRSEDDEDGRSLSVPMQAAIAMLFGTAVLLAARQTHDRTRTRTQNRQLGIRAAGLMSCYFFLEGVITATSALTFGWVPTLAVVLLLAAGIRSHFVRRTQRTESSRL